MASSLSSSANRPSTNTDSRRPPAHLSVSLRHGPSVNGPQPISQTSLNSTAPIPLNKVPTNESSDEQDTNSETNPIRWFNRANNHPKVAFSQALHDEEPYLLTKPGSRTHNHVALSDQGQIYPDVARSSSLKQHQANTNNGSSVDDFRSVIDDLTIENKKLKGKLKRLEKSHPSHLEKDRLFEVTIHGLSAKRRRLLEEKLREFTASLDDSSTSDDAQLSPERAKLSPAEQPTDQKRSTGSSNSISRPPDSAYASMSYSVPISNSNFTTNAFRGKDRQPTQQGDAENAENIKQFLQGIPEGLLPTNNSTMSERQKKTLVVQRLEQLFTGKKRVIGMNTQPAQQQEVAASAARADDVAANRSAQADGVREAHMLPTSADVDFKPGRLPTSSSREDLNTTNTSSSDGCGSDDSEIEQRPTRPLDLDPDRAQVAAENVEYLRHLGLSTPQLISEDSSDAEPDAQGWIYLNLLINMAQLHIINVTPDFVRKAVQEVSDKLQLSKDGHKLRWRGGSKGTRFSSINSGSSGSPDDSDSVKDETHVKRRKLDGGRFAAVPVNVEKQYSAAGGHNSAKLHYRPMFNHKDSATGSSISGSTSLISRHNDMLEEQSLGPRSGISHSAARMKRPRDDGTMVFYSNAQFCTDLSGDRHIPTPLYAGLRKDGYINAVHVLGMEGEPMASPYSPNRHSDRHTPPSEICKASQSSSELSVYGAYTSSRSLEDDQNQGVPQSFEACGLGGTQPADHFTIQCQTGRTRLRSPSLVSKFSAPTAKMKRFLHRVSTSALDAFSENNGGRMSSYPAVQLAPSPPRESDSFIPAVQTKYLSATFQRLPPSRLPDPTGYYGTSSNSDDGESDMGAYTAASSVYKLRNADSPRLRTAASNAPSQIWLQSVKDKSIGRAQEKMKEEEIEEGEDCDDDDDMSIDMLGHMRDVDPHAVAAQEEAFDMANRPVEMDVAVSAAATIAESDEEF